MFERPEVGELEGSPTRSNLSVFFFIKMTKQIQLTKDKVALVDNQDFERLNQWTWHAFFNGYGKWYATRSEGKWPFQKTILMHREIMNTPSNMQVDHIDGNGLNNTRNNLRNCTRSQNQQNAKKHSNNRNGYKGIKWNKKDKRWRAEIRVDGKQIYLGSFLTTKEAAQAYDKAARQYFGEFANTNF